MARLSKDTWVVVTDSEKALFLYGKTARTKNAGNSAADEVAKQDFSGSYGYVLD